MAVEVYPGPGTESKRSTRYTAEVLVSGVPTAAYVYGVARASSVNCVGWSAGESPEMSWLTFGCDLATTVRISLVSGPVTAAVIYPNDYASSIDAGDLVITLPPKAKVFVQLNGDDRNPLMLFADGLKPAIPAGAIDYVVAGSPPEAAEGEVIYFPPGVHTIGQLWKINQNAGVYLDGGAWVIGSFDVSGASSQRNVLIQGPGVLSGEFSSPEVVQALPSFDQQTTYTMLYGQDGIAWNFSNKVAQGITIVNTPFYAMLGMTKCDGVKIISPWYFNCDGFRVTGSIADGYLATVRDCFAFCADDACVVAQSFGDVEVIDSFIGVSSASAFMVSYWPEPVTPEWITKINNCKALSYALPDANNGNSIVRCWLDGEIGEESQGRFRITFEDLRVLGPIYTLLFTIENKIYPYPGVVPAQARGQAADWTFDGLVVEQTPLRLSRLMGLDNINTPHDLTFTNVTIGGVVVNSANWSTFVNQNQFPYNITLDAAPAVEAAPVATSPADIIAAIDLVMVSGAEVAAYTVNGRTVQLRGIDELLRARRYFEGLVVRSQGIRRTRVAF